MKTKSQIVAGLDVIQKKLSPLFKSNGFIKKGRSYNKTVKDGLVHVIGFQMGKFPVGSSETAIVSGQRDTYYGKVAINLGVYIPWISFLEHGILDPDFIREYHCEIRMRLTEKADDLDQWFTVPENPGETTKRIFRVLDEKGLGFLDQFQSIQDVFIYFKKNKNLPGYNSENRSKFIIALIYFAYDNIELFEKYITDITFNQEHDGFKQHVERVAEKLRNNIRLRREAH